MRRTLIICVHDISVKEESKVQLDFFQNSNCSHSYSYSTKRIIEKALFAVDCEIIAEIIGVPCILLAKSRAASKN